MWKAKTTRSFIQSTSTTACRCASTSTSELACEHVISSRTNQSLSKQQSFATLAAQDRQLPRSNAGNNSNASAAAMNYAAPLWPNDAWQSTQIDRKWNDWIRQSRVPPHPSDSTTTSTTLIGGATRAPAAAGSSSSSAPSPLRQLPVSSTPASSRSIEVDLATGQRLITRYLTLRSQKERSESPIKIPPLDPVERFSSKQLALMLETSRRLEMNVVENFLLADLSSPCEKPNEESKPANKSIRLPPWPEWPNSRDVLQQIVSVDNGAPARSELLTKAMAPTTSTNPHIDSLNRLKMVWVAFLKQDYLEQEPVLALRFLYSLVTASDDHDRPLPYLPFALDVLRRLLRSGIISESDVKAAPTDVGAGKNTREGNDLALRLVLLRAIAASADRLSQESLVIQAMQLLDRMGQIASEDVLLLEKLLSSRTERIRESRLYQFTPSNSELLEQACSLATSLLPLCISRVSKDSSNLYSILDDLTTELIVHNRRDLFVPLYIIYSNLGWCPVRSSETVLDLSLYLGGEAPFAHYPPTLALVGTTSSRSPRRQTVRDLHVDLWNDYVTAVRERCDDSESDPSSTWTLEAKNRFIKHLCQGRIVDLDLAHQFFQLWSASLKLSHSTALALTDGLIRQSQNRNGEITPLVRTSVETIAASLIRSRVKANVRLTHEDLTVLAGIYARLNDINSVVEIYKKLMSTTERILPDPKDLELLIEFVGVRYWLERAADNNTSADKAKNQKEGGGIDYAERWFAELMDQNYVKVDLRLVHKIARSVHRQLRPADPNEPHPLSRKAFHEWASRTFDLNAQDQVDLRGYLFRLSHNQARIPILFHGSSNRRSEFQTGRFDEYQFSKIQQALKTYDRTGRLAEALYAFQQSIWPGGIRSEHLLKQTLTIFFDQIKKQPTKRLKNVLIRQAQEILEAMRRDEVDVIRTEHVLLKTLVVLRQNWTCDERSLVEKRFRVAEWFVERYERRNAQPRGSGGSKKVKKMLLEFKGEVKSLLK